MPENAIIRLLKNRCFSFQFPNQSPDNWARSGSDDEVMHHQDDHSSRTV